MANYQVINKPLYSESRMNKVKFEFRQQRQQQHDMNEPRSRFVREASIAHKCESRKGESRASNLAEAMRAAL